MDHLTREKLLSPKQHGFVNGRYTVTQLLNYLDRAANAIAEGKVVDVIYFDFAKAFDTVPHRRLLKKLEGYGVKNEVLLWVESFLKDRHQLVKVHGAKSEKKKVLSGVPQGIVFGLLFLICLLYTSPSPRDATLSRMPSSA